MLRTGDLGAWTTDGYYSIVGRLKRFAKLFGRRVSLEDIERELLSRGSRARHGGRRRTIGSSCARGDGPGAVRDELIGHLARFLGVPPSAVVVRVVAGCRAPRPGKKDYSALEARR